MIFGRTWRQVLDGTKTQTRRIVKAGDYAFGKEYRGVNSGKHIQKWRVGHTYAVQPGRGEKAIRRILLTGIRQEQLQNIHGADVMAEGCWTGNEFIRLWDNIHRKGNRWGDNPEVWVLEFELVR